MIQKDKNPTSAALFGVAAIQAVVGLLGWSIHGPSFALIDWIIAFSFVVFIILAVVARRMRRLAALIALVLYGGLLCWQGIISAQLLLTGLMFKVPNIVLLLTAFALACKRRSSGNES